MSTEDWDQQYIGDLNEDQKSSYKSWSRASQVIFCGQTAEVRDKIMKGESSHRRSDLMSHVLDLNFAQKKPSSDGCFNGAFKTEEESNNCIEALAAQIEAGRSEQQSEEEVSAEDAGDSASERSTSPASVRDDGDSGHVGGGEEQANRS